MKTLLFYVAALGTVLGLAACSKSGSNNSTTATTAVATTSTVCTAGSIYTSQYGCLPTANCTQYGTNYGWSTTVNQCVVGTTDLAGACGVNMLYSAQYGCVSQCGVDSGWVNGTCLVLNTTAYPNTGYPYTNTGYPYETYGSHKHHHYDSDYNYGYGYSFGYAF